MFIHGAAGDANVLFLRRRSCKDSDGFSGGCVGDCSVVWEHQVSAMDGLGSLLLVLMSRLPPGHGGVGWGWR